ncbi:MAG: hypothetical protein GY716_09135 [bacterium]|nr:hypothetical protein [bacterium]
MRSSLLLVPFALAVAVCAGAPRAADPNLCDVPGERPDLVVGDIVSVNNYGVTDGVASYSLGSDTCNLGTCWVDWFASTTAHPVFTQNLYRLSDGRFEQLGQSWAVHRFFALSNPGCSTECEPTDGTHLGVNCSTVNSAGINGAQAYMGPKSEIDPSKGDFPFPFATQNQTGDVLYKRLQARTADLADPGASYFVEGHTVAADDAVAENGGNNASWRPVVVVPVGGSHNLNAVETTRLGQPAIEAWREADPLVNLDRVRVPGDGNLIVGSRALPVGDGMWRYEYAVQNLDSYRSVGSFSVPLPTAAALAQEGFHDVDYHSGEPYDGADWGFETGAGRAEWSTSSHDENPDANALRWATLYNFRLDTDAPPVVGEVTLGLFRPGVPGDVLATAVVPRMCNGDGSCDAGESACGCPEDCGSAPATELDCGDGVDGDCDGLPDCVDSDCCGGAGCEADDLDGDGFPACLDCNDADATVWTAPGEVATLAVDGPDPSAALSWAPPLAPGGSDVEYMLLRSSSPTDFGSAAICLDSGDPSATTATDAGQPAPGTCYGYLVGAKNACPVGQGPLGGDSAGYPRLAQCP